jgi:predicted RNase H-like HicB family nuclease
MLTAIFQSTEEGGFYATIRELPEVQTEGETLEEAEENLQSRVANPNASGCTN